MTPDLKTLERKLADVRQEVRNLVVMGMAPDQSPEQVALIKKRESSARAEVRLRTLMLEYWKRVPTTPKNSFVMTAQEHRAMAECLRELGRHQSAQHHDHLARLAEARQNHAARGLL